SSLVRHHHHPRPTPLPYTTLFRSPQQLIEAMQKWERGQLSQSELNAISEEAVRDTVRRFEATGSPIITDGEQNKPSFATYPIYGDRKSTRLNSSHRTISYAVFCWK